MNLWLAFIVTLVLCVLWLRIIDFLASKNYLSKKLSRKIVHIGTGPIFLLCWLFFPDNLWSKYVAAVIPFLITLQFFLIGIGVIKDQGSVDAMSRSGDPKEILKGPLFYGIAFIIVTILFWRNSPLGIITLMILCGGDGIADIVGRNISSPTLKWSKNKSIAGSIAMFIGGFIFSTVLVLIFIKSGYLHLDLTQSILKIIILNLVATIVESLPISDWDNVTVPVAVIFVGLIIF